MVSSFDRLYYEDSTCRHFTAIVTACQPQGGHYLVELDRTAFYPEGGGQPADTGTLGEARVLDVHERDGRILHTTGRPLAVGAEVAGSIDWERRFTFMQQHSGEHILSGILHALTGSDNVGFHIGSADTIVDFNRPLDEATLKEAEQHANQAVFADLPIQISYPSPETSAQMDYRSKIELGDDVRVVTVPGSDVCACCGTHVRTTGEIGLIKILTSQKYKGGTRLSIVCGNRALADYTRKNDQTNTVSGLLSVKSGEIVEGVRRLQDEAAALKLKTARLSRALFDCRAQALAGQPGPLCLFEDDAAPEDLRAFSLRLSEDRDDIAAVFSAVPNAEDTAYGEPSTASTPAGNGAAGSSPADASDSGSEIPAGNNAAGKGRHRVRRWRYAVASRKHDTRPFSKALNAAFSGTGGGNPRIAQGTLTAARQAIEDFIRDNAPI